MKYVLLLMFFVGSSDSDWQLANTVTSDYETKIACETAAKAVWEPFARAEKSAGAKRNGVNIAAWCLDKNASSSEANSRVHGVGIKPKKDPLVRP